MIDFTEINYLVMKTVLRFGAVHFVLIFVVLFLVVLLALFPAQRQKRLLKIILVIEFLISRSLLC